MNCAVDECNWNKYSNSNIVLNIIRFTLGQLDLYYGKYQHESDYREHNIVFATEKFQPDQAYGERADNDV